MVFLRVSNLLNWREQVMRKIISLVLVSLSVVLGCVDKAVPTTTTQLPVMVVKKSTTPPVLVYDKQKDGWEGVEGTDFSALAGEETVEFATFLESDERYVNGTVMLERAKALGYRADQRHAEQMLAQQADIPVEYREFYLVFPGTIWRGPRGRLYAPFLYWGGDAWYLDFRWLEGGWRSHCRVVRLRR